jgi:hypothetical protein
MRRLTVAFAALAMPLVAAGQVETYVIDPY